MNETRPAPPCASRTSSVDAMRSAVTIVISAAMASWLSTQCWPPSQAFPCSSAIGAWITATRGAIAGNQVSISPVTGHGARFKSGRIRK